MLFSSIWSVICLDSISWCIITSLNCRLPRDWVKIKCSNVLIQSWKDVLRKQWLRFLLLPLSSYICFVSLPLPVRRNTTNNVLIPSKFWLSYIYSHWLCHSIWTHLRLILYNMNIVSARSFLFSTGIKSDMTKRLLEIIGHKLNILMRLKLNPS